MKLWHVCLLVAVPTGVGIFFLNRSNEAISKLHHELDAIHAETTAFAARPSEDDRTDEAARAALRILQTAGATPAAQKTEAPPPAAATASPKEAAKRRDWKPDDLRDYFTAAFTGETSDAQWATSARRVAEDRVSADLPAGSSVRSIDCRESMCRIETRHEDMDRFHEFVRRSFGDPATAIWNAGAFSTVLEGGDGRPGEPLIVVSYLAREGNNLPNPATDD